MASYTYEEKRVLLSTPIEAVLAYYGKDTSHDHSNLYFSPFRDEANRSFHIHLAKNAWYDFGLAEGGGVLTLVRRLASCSMEQAFDELAQMNTSFIPSYTRLNPVSVSRKKSNAIVIDYMAPCFRNSRLIAYAASRGISRETLDRFCKQITYYCKSHPCLKHTAIGFPNDEGGYVLRSRTGKRCSSSSISTIQASGDAPSAGLAVFEGFFDFLSWIEDSPQVITDAVVLNSVSNLKSALPLLCGREEIYLYLDRDAAGQQAARQIEYFCVNQKTRVIDMSHIYAGFKDYNEMLLNRCTTHKTQDSYGSIITNRCPGKTGQNQLGEPEE